MECPECFQELDEKQNRPKALPCGHTFCLECLHKVDRCFIDRKPFEVISLALPDNHNILAAIRSKSTTKNWDNVLYAWCINCDEGALDSCVDEGHEIASRKTLDFQKILEKLAIPDGNIELRKIQQHYDINKEAAAEAKEILSGKAAPVDILLQGRKKRWITSLKWGDTSDKAVQSDLLQILSLMRIGGTAPKELLIQVTADDTTSEENFQNIRSELDLTNISSCKDQQSVEVEKHHLATSDYFQHVKLLTGLYCDRDRAWCLELLQSLALTLEEVHLFDFHIEHLEAVHCMPQLCWLVLESFMDDMKQRKDYEIPCLKHQSKVKFLWVNTPGFHNMKLLESIIKSHQISLQVLMTSLPSYHSVAIDFMNKMSLPNLQMLMYSVDYCGSDNCRNTMQGLRKRFPAIKILCLGCRRTETFDS